MIIIIGEYAATPGAPRSMPPSFMKTADGQPIAFSCGTGTPTESVTTSSCFH
jgi:hypothetical protein